MHTSQGWQVTTISLPAAGRAVTESRGVSCVPLSAAEPRERTANAAQSAA